MDISIPTLIFILSIMSVSAMPPMHGSHHPHLGHMGAFPNHMPFDPRSGHFVMSSYGHGHPGFGIQSLAMPEFHGMSMAGRGGFQHHGMGMHSHQVPVYGEPGVRLSGMGHHMGPSYLGYRDHGLYGMSGGYHSASQPSVVYHGASPGHAGIPIVDHGTDSAIREILKGSREVREHAPQESQNNNVLLGIPMLKGSKITLPGFLIHHGRGANDRSSGHELTGGHSMARPRVIFGGSVTKPFVIDHASGYHVPSTYGVKYPVIGVKRQRKGNLRDGHKLWA